MRKIAAVILVLFCALQSQAQTFSWSGFHPLADLETDTIALNVSGLPTSINSGFGLSRVCFDIYHSYKANLVLTLLAPDGHSVLLVQNQGGGSDNFVGTCVAMDGVPFALGTAPYAGVFLPAGDVSSFNNGQNPNGIWRLLVTDIISPDTGSVRLVSLQFGNNPPSGNGLGGNNLGPAGPFVYPGVVCPGGASGCELLPDVTASAFEIFNNHSEQTGSLMVSNGTPNIGYGPLEIFGIDSCFCEGVPSPCNVVCPDGGELQHIIRQRIYRKIPGTDTLGFYDRDAGAMTFHPEHGHLHVDDWANYTLRKPGVNPDPRTWEIVGTSIKQSYCLVNLGTCAGTPGECVDNNGNTVLTVPNNGFGFYSGCGLNQGIYPGSYDVYSETLNEPIPLDNVCNGDYYIVSITDPTDMFLESDETNNWVKVPVTLTRQKTIPLIEADRPGNTICPGDSITLTASVSPGGYLWSNGATTRSIVVKTSGSYTVSCNCNNVSNSVSLPYVANVVDPNSKPAVSISKISGDIACAGSAIVFKAESVNGGDAPVYQWKVDGVPVGVNNASFVSSSLTNGQVVRCEITSSVPCLASDTAVSNSITVTVNPVGQPATVALAISKGNAAQCAADTTVFKATTVNGTGLNYQWKVDTSNAGSNSDTFSTNTLTDGQKISCTVSTVAACPARINIGEGTLKNSILSTAGVAYPTYYGNGRQQYLVKAEELTARGLAPGNITSISFVTDSAVGDPDTLKGYTIKMASTAATALTANFLATGLVTVAGPVDYKPVLNAINTHYFSVPFNWDGVSNIVVDICFSNQVYGTASYQTFYSSYPFICNAYYRADNAAGANACSVATASATSFSRPNMLFGANELQYVSSDTITVSTLLPVYTFTGTGNWNIASNWQNGKMPPAKLLSCSEIVINPAGTAECILNVPQTIAPGAKITVVSGKKFRVTSNMLIRE